MKKLILLLFFFALLSFSQVFAQMGWGELITQPNLKLSEVEAEVEAYMKQYPNARPPKPMLRWIERMKAHTNEQGVIDRTREINGAMTAQRLRQQASRSGTWRHLGPVNPVNNLFEGIGRVNALAFHPTNSQIIFAGTPSGGLWKSTNYGQSWSPLTDNLPSMGVSDVVIDPRNGDVIYMATGDNDGQDTPCFGILKSTDGGQNWTNVFPINANGWYVDEMLIDPTHPDTLLAATSRGVYRTTDAGANWTLTQGGNFEDMVFHPTNSDTVYVVGYGGNDGFYRSTDNGQSWTQGANGLPIPANNLTNNLGRMMLATTPARPGAVYVLQIYNNQNSYAFNGLYYSENAGLDFVSRTNSSANLNFRQGWYDLAINVSPFNAEEIYVGDFPFYRSLNGGQSWSERSDASNNTDMHVDIHDIEFHPLTGDLWVANDGGAYYAPNRNPANTFTMASNGLAITQFYRLGTSVHDNEEVVAGSQDNGIMHRRTPTFWDQFPVYADGMEALVSWEDPNFYVYSSQRGNIRKNQNGNQSSFINRNTTGADGAWVTPFVQDPNEGRTFYAGYRGVWKTENAATWENISGNIANGNLHKIFVPQISQGFFIYAATRSTFYQSLDKGVSWRNYPLNNGQGSFQDMAVDPKQPQTIYGAFSNGVFKSTDAGQSWTDMSAGLPSLPIYTIVYQRGGPDALYAGTAVGVYYRDSTMSNWIPFMAGLPNVEVAELEISYCAGKIRAATYGRGVWESDLYPNGFQPLGASVNIDPGTDNFDASLEVEGVGGYGPYRYLWNGAIPLQVLNNPSSGIYTVEVTDKNHCTYRDTILFAATAIEGDLSELIGLQLYPNPTRSELNLRFQSQKAGQGVVKLQNAVGQVMYQQPLQIAPGENSIQLSLSDLSAGLYILSLEAHGESLHSRVVVE
jgi:photosystem II stability/assembly factor-like uncharacterized protein